MENKIFRKRQYLYLIFGVLMGYIISSLLILSVNDLKTPSSDYMGTDEDIVFANSIGLASFDGAWIMISDGDKMTNDINSVTIDCWLLEKICNIAQAQVVFDDIFSNDISYYEITEWTPSGQITAINNSICEDQVLKADIKTKVVTLTESKKENADQTICVQSSKPVVLKLGQRGY